LTLGRRDTNILVVQVLGHELGGEAVERFEEGYLHLLVPLDS
jgi:hypothetical protein